MKWLLAFGMVPFGIIGLLMLLSFVGSVFQSIF